MLVTTRASTRAVCVRGHGKGNDEYSQLQLEPYHVPHRNEVPIFHVVRPHGSGRPTIARSDGIRESAAVIGCLMRNAGSKKELRGRNTRLDQPLVIHPLET